MFKDFEDFIVKMIFTAIVIVFAIIPTAIVIKYGFIIATIYYAIAFTIHATICYRYSKTHSDDVF
jgi:hypothetical protein